VSPWIWLAAGAVLIGIEVMLPSTWLIWPAISAAAVGLLGFAGMTFDWRIQCVLFAVLAVATTFVWQRRFRSYAPASERPKLNRRLASLVGRQGSVDREGLRLDDTVWRVRAADGSDVQPGQRVEVVGADGSELVVRPLP
jgi:membrane protein implicated in regulation of membrane protease activity